MYWDDRDSDKSNSINLFTLTTGFEVFNIFTVPVELVEPEIVRVFVAVGLIIGWQT